MKPNVVVGMYKCRLALSRRKDSRVFGEDFETRETVKRRRVTYYSVGVTFSWSVETVKYPGVGMLAATASQKAPSRRCMNDR
jgi:hypothetical protein